jgi:hypothetical protein
VKLVRSIGRNVDGVTGPNDDQVFPDKYGPYKDLAVDSRWEKITPPMCLTHSTGFSDFWFIEPDQKLHIHFEPGTEIKHSWFSNRLKPHPECWPRYIYGPADGTLAANVDEIFF